ncbi:MAG: putative sugar O-methyltransferase [bacterium]
MTFPFDALRYHYARWRRRRDAEAGLPPLSAEERTRVRHFRDAFRRLPVNVLDDMTATEADWAEAMNRLRELALHADPRAFQRWDVIAARMAHTSSPATPVELAALRAHPEWETRWRHVLREVPAGRPVPYAEFPESSESLIQTVHHVMQLERLTSHRVENWNAIVEFGGGFGGMCRALHTLGFRGQYLIYDLPPMVLLQRWYLEQVGLGDDSHTRVATTSEFVELANFVRDIPAGAHALFLATWSLSEAPMALRERVKPLVERMGHYFIGFQGRYGEVDNAAYFAKSWLRANHTERIAHRPDDFYMSGMAGVTAVAPPAAGGGT